MVGVDQQRAVAIAGHLDAGALDRTPRLTVQDDGAVDAPLQQQGLIEGDADGLVQFADLGARAGVGLDGLQRRGARPGGEQPRAHHQQQQRQGEQESRCGQEKPLCHRQSC